MSYIQKSSCGWKPHDKGWKAEGEGSVGGWKVLGGPIAPDTAGLNHSCFLQPPGALLALEGLCQCHFASAQQITDVICQSGTPTLPVSNILSSVVQNTPQLILQQGNKYFLSRFGCLFNSPVCFSDLWCTVTGIRYLILSRAAAINSQSSDPSSSSCCLWC